MNMDMMSGGQVKHRKLSAYTGYIVYLNKYIYIYTSHRIHEYLPTFTINKTIQI